MQNCSSNRCLSIKKSHISFNNPFEIYRNLSKPGYVFSLRQKGLVVAHFKADSTFIMRVEDPLLVVHEKSRERAIKNKVRNVHALIKGKMHRVVLSRPFNFKEKISYHYNTGWTCNGNPITHVDGDLFLTETGVYAYRNLFSVLRKKLS